MRIEIVSYRPEHFEGVDSLWREAFPDDPPKNRAAAAIPAKLAVQPELFLVALEADRVVGTTMAGYDGHRGWLYSVAVSTSHRRRGVGAQLVGEAERRLAALGCPKVNLQVRPANSGVVGFYRTLGYAIEERIGLGKSLHDDGVSRDQAPMVASRRRRTVAT
ncbi:MAG TPA: GNAT family acetyltransferase [Caulobacteraceae bacterium]|nr:GNAT family acetyltransferase [Caulobacteraceae bacterium]